VEKHLEKLATNKDVIEKLINEVAPESRPDLYYKLQSIEGDLVKYNSYKQQLMAAEKPGSTPVATSQTMVTESSNSTGDVGETNKTPKVHTQCIMPNCTKAKHADNLCVDCHAKNLPKQEVCTNPFCNKPTAKKGFCDGCRCVNKDCANGKKGTANRCSKCLIKAHKDGEKIPCQKCAKQQVGSSWYCADHKCRVQGCVKEKEQKKDLCEGHEEELWKAEKCGNDACDQKKEGNSPYCKTCESKYCIVTGCKEPMEKGTSYCKDHRPYYDCENNGCSNKRVGGVRYCDQCEAKPYCETYSCQNKVRYQGSTYCEECVTRAQTGSKDTTITTTLRSPGPRNPAQKTCPTKGCNGILGLFQTKCDKCNQCEAFGCTNKAGFISKYCDECNAKLYRPCKKEGCTRIDASFTGYCDRCVDLCEMPRCGNRRELMSEHCSDHRRLWNQHRECETLGCTGTVGWLGGRICDACVHIQLARINNNPPPINNNPPPIDPPPNNPPPIDPPPNNPPPIDPPPNNPPPIDPPPNNPPPIDPPLGNPPPYGPLDPGLHALATLLAQMNRPGRTGPGEQRIVELPKFVGDVDDPHQWWRHFNDACEANNMTPERRLQIAPTCLRGQADVWRQQPGLVLAYWEAVPGSPAERVSFKKQFFDYFSTNQHQQNWMNELRNRRMKEGENVDAYAGALVELYRKADPTDQYPASDKLQTFLGGLPPQLRMFTELRGPRDFRDAWDQAKKVESTLKKSNPFGPDPSVTQVNTLMADQLIKLGASVSALATEVREEKKCSFCQRTGHVVENCYKKKNGSDSGNNRGSNSQPPSCYGCGMKGHLRRECRTTICRNCGRQGHFARECKFSKVQNGQQQPGWNQPPLPQTRSQTQFRPRQPMGGPNPNNQNQQVRPKRAFIAQGYEEQQPYDEQYEEQPYYQGYEERYQPPAPRTMVKPPSQPESDPYLTMAAAVTSLVNKLDHLKD